MPCLPLLSNTTSIVSVPPGAMGSLVGSAIVQPQLPLADVIIKFDLPSLVNENLCDTFSPCIIFPKSYVPSANLITGNLSLSTLPLAVPEKFTISPSIFPSFSLLFPQEKRTAVLISTINFFITKIFGKDRKQFSFTYPANDVIFVKKLKRTFYVFGHL